MGGAVGIAISLVSIWIWWPHGGLVLGAAIVVGIVDWWSYGVMHNFAMNAACSRPVFQGPGEPDGPVLGWSILVPYIHAARNRRRFRGGFWDITRLESEEVPNVYSGISLGTFLAQTGILIWGVIQDTSITWWQALLAVIVLSTVLIFSPRLIVWLPLLAIVLMLIRG